MSSDPSWEKAVRRYRERQAGRDGSEASRPAVTPPSVTPSVTPLSSERDKARVQNVTGVTDARVRARVDSRSTTESASPARGVTRFEKLALGETERKNRESKKELARRMRKEPTPAERVLWLRLRRNQTGFRFVQQRFIYGWIVDFYCPQANLVVELDGFKHDDARDDHRDEALARNGIRTIRFLNSTVLGEPEKVIESILQACRDGVHGGASSYQRAGLRRVQTAIHPAGDQPSKSDLTSTDKKVLLGSARLGRTTYRELGDAVGLRSTSTVFTHVERLRQRRLVRWEPGRNRTLMLMPGLALWPDGEPAGWLEPV